jgi:hypothetical protein
MKLAKALKLKNKLAGDVARLKDLLGKQNVRPTKQAFDYNNTEVLADLRAKTEELVKVKAAIAAANSEIYDKIFRLAELKGLVVVLNGLDTRHGVFLEHGNYGGEPAEVEFVAQLKKVQVDKLVDEFQAEIQVLQDSLDEFNHTRAVGL